MDGKKVGEQVVEAVRGFVSRSLAPLTENLSGLIARVDKVQQQSSAQASRLAALERKLADLEKRR